MKIRLNLDELSAFQSGVTGRATHATCHRKSSMWNQGEEKKGVM